MPEVLLQKRFRIENTGEGDQFKPIHMPKPHVEIFTKDLNIKF